MLAAKVEPEWCGVVYFDSCADELPAFGDVLLWSCEFEIVNVDDKKEVELWVVVATSPFGYELESLGENMCFTMLFPVSAGVGVAVKCKQKWDNGVVVFAMPVWWPLVVKDSYPCFDAVEFGLCVCLRCVGLLAGVTWEE